MKIFENVEDTEVSERTSTAASSYVATYVMTGVARSWSDTYTGSV